MVLLLQGELQTQDVDWLFWEDPFIEGRDPDELRQERETSREETMKQRELMFRYATNTLLEGEHGHHR